MSRRLIDIANATFSWDENDKNDYGDDFAGGALFALDYLTEKEPAVDAVELPCKIGDYVWAIRSYRGHKHPQRGIVGEMFFTQDMKLMIVIKHVARGVWGEKVFATYEDALAAIERRETT